MVGYQNCALPRIQHQESEHQSALLNTHDTQEFLAFLTKEFKKWTQFVRLAKNPKVMKIMLKH